MPIVHWLDLTPEACQALRREAQGEFRDTSEPLPNGMRRVPFKDATIQALRLAMLPSESPSDTILRITSTYRTGVN